MALHRVDRFCNRLGSGEVAQTPAGHRIGFAKPVHRNREVVGLGSQRSDADVFGAIISELFVDLVREDEDIFLGGDFGDRAELLPGVDRSGRITGAVDDDHLRAGSHRVFKILSGDLPLVLFLRLDDDRDPSGQADHLRVAEPERCGNDHLVAGVDDRGNRVEAGMLCAAAHDHLAWLVNKPVIAGELFRDGFAELRDSRAWRVFRLAVLEGSDRCSLDVLGRIHVRLTSSKSADVNALGLHGFGFAVDGEGE